jgi:hypothetical protein
MTLFQGLQGNPPPVFGAAGQGASLHLRTICHQRQEPPDPNLYSLLNRPFYGAVADHCHRKRDPLTVWRFLGTHLHDLGLYDLALRCEQDGPSHHPGTVDKNYLVTRAATQWAGCVPSLRCIEGHRSSALH